MEDLHKEIKDETQDNDTIKNGYIDMLARGFKVNGYTSRSDYWVALAIHAGVYLFLALISGGESIFILIYLFLTAIPVFTMGMRRLEDAGFSILWMFVPILGSVMTLMPSKRRQTHTNTTSGSESDLSEEDISTLTRRQAKAIREALGSLPVSLQMIDRSASTDLLVATTLGLTAQCMADFSQGMDTLDVNKEERKSLTSLHRDRLLEAVSGIRIISKTPPLKRAVLELASSSDSDLRESVGEFEQFITSLSNRLSLDGHIDLGDSIKDLWSNSVSETLANISNTLNIEFES